MPIAATPLVVTMSPRQSSTTDCGNVGLDSLQQEKRAEVEAAAAELEKYAPIVLNASRCVVCVCRRFRKQGEGRRCAGFPPSFAIVPCGVWVPKGLALWSLRFRVGLI